MSTGPEVPEDGIDLPYLHQIASSPRRISVDGVDYQGQSLSELMAFYRFGKTNEEGEGSACNGFRSTRLIRQQASPPSALGIHFGRGC